MDCTVRVAQCDSPGVSRHYGAGFSDFKSDKAHVEMLVRVFK